MNENLSSIVISSLFICLWIWAMVSTLVKVGKNRIGPVKTGKATVVDKHKVEDFSKYSGTGKRERYVVVFSVEGKKKAFYVSEFSYSGYRINEKGTIKYKGDRLIEFK